MLLDRLECLDRVAALKETTNNVHILQNVFYYFHFFISSSPTTPMEIYLVTSSSRGTTRGVATASICTCDAG